MFEQDRVIVRLQQRILREPDVFACFLAGSVGRRSNDGYSDLDVALVFASAAYREAAWQNRYHFVKSVLPYVPAKSFDAIHVRPYLHIALYGNGAKVDYRYETTESLRPNAWDREINILKDEQGWCERFKAASERASLNQPSLTAAELVDLDNRFWVMFWDTYRLLLRGDSDKPFTIYLELLHFSLPPLLRLLPPDDPARPDLLQASFGHDTKATVGRMAHLLDAYLAARTAIVQRLNLEFIPDRGFEQAIGRLVERAGKET
jgi:hypothetical protein